MPKPLPATNSSTKAPPHQHLTTSTPYLSQTRKQLNSQPPYLQTQNPKIQEPEPVAAGSILSATMMPHNPAPPCLSSSSPSSNHREPSSPCRCKLELNIPPVPLQLSRRSPPRSRRRRSPCPQRAPTAQTRPHQHPLPSLFLTCAVEPQPPRPRHATFSAETAVAPITETAPPSLQTAPSFTTSMHLVSVATLQHPSHRLPSRASSVHDGDAAIKSITKP
ncbi:hypothetical protein M0R45_005937 [Rubus argutus]|uniref:Uncharacterized protein n=1 Tax=Rubus argutus TaxID=59490 RepID=A0AAW1YP18_RUBAR